MTDFINHFWEKSANATGSILVFCLGGWWLLFREFDKRVSKIEEEYIPRREIEDLKITLRELDRKIDRILERRNSDL